MTRNAHIVYLLINWPPRVVLQNRHNPQVGKAEGEAGGQEAAPGTPRVAFILVAPLIAYQLEQLIHWVIDGLNWRYYRGDGSTEWFIFPAHFVAFAFMAVGWLLWLALIYATWTYFLT